MSLRRSAYALAALVGLIAAGLGLVGVAAAAPTDPSPASTAPSTADPAPAPPVPLVYQPVDARDGLFGVPRGSVPTASTPGMPQVPVMDKLPVIDVTPLPAQHTSDDGTDESTTDADQ